MIIIPTLNPNIQVTLSADQQEMMKKWKQKPVFYNFIKIVEPKPFSKIIANTIGICTLEIIDNVMNVKHILTETEKIFDQFKIIK